MYIPQRATQLTAKNLGFRLRGKSPEDSRRNFTVYTVGGTYLLSLRSDRLEQSLTPAVIFSITTPAVSLIPKQVVPSSPVCFSTIVSLVLHNGSFITNKMTMIVPKTRSGCWTISDKREREPVAAQEQVTSCSFTKAPPCLFQPQRHPAPPPQQR